MPFCRAPFTETDATPIALRDPVFIADLHLSVTVPALRGAFIAFLDAFDWHPQLRNRQELVILGDFFDAWLGDDTREDFADVLRALERFVATPNAAGAKRHLYLMQGNRDFLMGAPFAKSVNARLLADPVLATIGEGTDPGASMTALLSHGDRWCVDDARYQTVRARLRRPWIQCALLALPLFIRRQVARNARAKSQSVKAQVANHYILDVTPSAVLADALAFHTSLVIHGHTHRPAVHSLSPTPVTFSPTAPQTCGSRWVLADWVVEGDRLVKGDALCFDAGRAARLPIADILSAKPTR